MRFDLFKSIGENWYITIISNRSYIYDDEVASILSLSLEEYHQILISFGGKINSIGECCFETREEIENAIKELEPYLIMANLSK